MVSIIQIQEYLHHIAQKQYETVKIPFFRLYFHPNDLLAFFNYAIPEDSKIDDLGDTLTRMRTEFSKRNRRTRLEFLQEYNPELERILRRNNFVEESRQYLMVCTAGIFRPGSKVANLVIEEINERAELSESQEFLRIQRMGFGGKETEKVTFEEAKYFLRVLGKGSAFVGMREGNSIAVGMVTEPHNGISELAGLATLDSYRPGGIATAITTRAVERAFEQGVEIVFLTAADEKAGRVYQKVGFKNFTTVLAYIDEDETG